MKKVALLILLIFSLNKASSQVWCYPGAIWHYTHYNAYASLYAKHTYVYDTIILGKNCNKITYYTQGFGTFGPVSYFNTPYFTYVNNNVVYLYDQAASSFDTLFNYNATIGDSWIAAPISYTGCVTNITVSDTGHSFIQGKFLKWMKVNMVSPYYMTGKVDTIFERIGCLNNYLYYPQDFCPTALHQERGGPLRCYDDNQIVNYKHMYNQACNYYYLPTGIDKLNKQKNIFLYPNPANDNLEVHVDNGSKISEIKLINELGQTVLITTKTHLDISDIAMGVYYLKILFEDSSICNEKFVKE